MIRHTFADCPLPGTGPRVKWFRSNAGAKPDLAAALLQLSTPRDRLTRISSVDAFFFPDMEFCKISVEILIQPEALR